MCKGFGLAILVSDAPVENYLGSCWSVTKEIHPTTLISRRGMVHLHDDEMLIYLTG